MASVRTRVFDGLFQLTVTVTVTTLDISEAAE